MTGQDSDWTTALTNPQAIRSLFGQHTPSVEGVYLRALEIPRDAPHIFVELLLPVGAVQLKLLLFPLRAIEFRGWDPQCPLVLRLERAGTGEGSVIFELSGDQVALRLKADFVTVSGARKGAA